MFLEEGGFRFRFGFGFRLGLLVGFGFRLGLHFLEEVGSGSGSGSCKHVGGLDPEP